MTHTRPIQDRRSAVALVEQAEAAAEHLFTAEQPEAWDWLQEHCGELLDIAERWHVDDVHVAIRALKASGQILNRSSHSASYDALILVIMERIAGPHPELVGELRYLLGRSAALRGDFHTARRRIRAATRAGDDSAHTRGLWAHIAIRTGCFDEAERLLDVLEREAPGQLSVALQRGFLTLARGEFDVAEAQFLELRASSQARGDLFHAAATTFFLSECMIRAERTPEALHWIAVAYEEFAPFGLQALHLLLWTWEARCRREQGRLGAALELARRAFEASQEWAIPESALESSIELFAIHRSGGELDAAMRWYEEIQIWLPVCARPEVITRAQATLASLREDRPHVATTGIWFERDGKRVDLSRRRALRAILGALAQGKPLGVAEIFAAGWPGESIAQESEVRRVYTAVWQLRRLGLGEHLRNDASGYRLGDKVRVV